MEPGSSRRNLPCPGDPEPGDLREETPGEEAQDGDSRLRDGGGGDGQDKDTANKMDEEETDAQEKADEDEGDDKYEEELDPRIQA